MLVIRARPTSMSHGLAVTRRKFWPEEISSDYMSQYDMRTIIPIKYNLFCVKSSWSKEGKNRKYLFLHSLVEARTWGGQH